MEVNPGLTSPRVNLKVMNKYRGLSSPVRFVGKVLRLTQEMLVLEAPVNYFCFLLFLLLAFLSFFLLKFSSLSFFAYYRMVDK